MAISDGLSKEEITKMADDIFLKTALSEMTKEDVDAYMSLSNDIQKVRCMGLRGPMSLVLARTLRT